MNWKTLLFLLLLVGGLLYLTRLQEGSEQHGPEFYQGPLLGGVRPEDVTEIRWEHIERAEYVALEKQDGTWMLTDPLEYPAAPDRVKLVLDGLFTQAIEIPKAEPASLAPHFDPPRAIVTVIESKEGGAQRSHELEVGSLDPDGMQMEVRYEGRYLRILRNLDAVLESSISDLRDKRIFRVTPNRIVTIERQGFTEIEGGLRDLAFTARREGPAWKQYDPVRVQLDPVAMGLWARVLSAIYVEAFVSDVPEPDLERYGLAQPEAKLTLTDAAGGRQELWFTNQEGGGWAATLVGSPYVYALPSAIAQQLTDAWTDLRDGHLLRSLRDDLGQIELQVGDEVVRLSQGAAHDADWTVARRRSGSLEFDAEWPADKARVGEFLGDWEQAEIVSWLPPAADPIAQCVPAGAPTLRVSFHFRNALLGEVASALVGPVTYSDAGTPLRTFLRDGDGVVALIAAPLGSWLEGGIEAWRSPLVWDLKESRLKSLRLTQGTQTRTFLRKLQGTWRYVDADVTPTELLPLLDHLVYLKAERYLAQDSVEELLDPVRVEFETVDGTWMVAEIGPDSAGQVRLAMSGFQAIARNQDLYAGLSKLLGG